MLTGYKDKRLALGTGKKQWLNIPTGTFGQGNGIISK